MIPSVDDRLASIVRALSDIIQPALPADASLARDLTALSIAHLQILRAQLDAAPAFELEELADARALAMALLEKGEGGGKTEAALVSLRESVHRDNPDELPRQARAAINTAIDSVIRNASLDASTVFRSEMAKIVISMQAARVLKDRKWFVPMGFDTDVIE